MELLQHIRPYRLTPVPIRMTVSDHRVGGFRYAATAGADLVGYRIDVDRPSEYGRGIQYSRNRFIVRYGWAYADRDMECIEIFPYITDSPEVPCRVIIDEIHTTIHWSKDGKDVYVTLYNDCVITDRKFSLQRFIDAGLHRTLPPTDMLPVGIPRPYPDRVARVHRLAKIAIPFFY